MKKNSYNVQFQDNGLRIRKSEWKKSQEDELLTRTPVVQEATVYRYGKDAVNVVVKPKPKEKRPSYIHTIAEYKYTKVKHGKERYNVLMSFSREEVVEAERAVRSEYKQWFDAIRMDMKSSLTPLTPSP